MTNTMETVWILKIGALQKFVADNEFTNGLIRRFMMTNDIKIADRPVRRHNRTGTVEHKHRNVKLILVKLQNNATTASDTVFLARATVMSNIFSGSSIPSAFQNPQGCSTALIGVGHRLINPEIIESYQA